jgi:ABC-2 type transport system permease protein
MLLLFDYFLGGTIGHGLGDAARGAPYVDFLVPGILMMAVAGGCGPTAINVTMDMTGGFIDRIRTMAITRGALLAGHVGGNVLRTLVATAAVTGVALLVGFRPKASVADWFAVVGIVAAFASCPGLAVRGHRPSHEECRWRERLNPAPVVPTAIPVQHFRAGRLNACRRALVRREPAVHRGGGQPARAAQRRAGRQHPYVALAWCAAIALVSYFWAQAAFRRGSR